MEHKQTIIPITSYTRTHSITDNNNNTNTNYFCSSNSNTLPKHLQFTRGFSKVQANEDILSETRNQIESNLYKTHDSKYHLKNDFSFMLPDFNKFDDYKFKEYLQNDLIELPTQCALSESGHLNWWTQAEWEGVCRPLYPMCTSGDGNCLLHAASLSMWGLHDRYLILRKALHSTLENLKENQSPLWRRWKWEQMCQNRKYGLIYSDEEWSKEWKSLLKLSSYKPRVSVDNLSQNESSSINMVQQDGQVYFESLEEFHVFLLAHILQRPIIIVSDTMLHDSDGEPLSPIPFGGIYLPFECDLNKCHRYPLVLAYDSAHFSALVLMNDLDNQDYTLNGAGNIHEINKKLQSVAPYAVVPITYSNGELLPFHFSYDPGEGYDWSKFNDQTQPEMEKDEEMYLLQKYLDLVKLELFEPGPAAKRSNLPTNTSGLKVNAFNVRVREPVVEKSRTNSTKIKTTSTSNKIQKFFNIFKKTNEAEPNGEEAEITENRKTVDSFKTSKLRKSIKTSGQSLFKSMKSTKTPSSSTSSSQPRVLSYNKIDDDFINSTLFHRVKEFNSWEEIYESLQSQKCLLCVKLNLAKPPKYDKIIANYIDSAKLKYNLIRQQETRLSQKQPILNSSSSLIIHNNNQKQNYQQNYQQHYCIVNNTSCSPSNLCNNCNLNTNSIRSIQINNPNAASSFVSNPNPQYSYNQFNKYKQEKQNTTHLNEYDLDEGYDNSNNNRVTTSYH